MNLRKEEIIGWLRSYYDKLVLVVILVAILLSLLYLIYSTGREKKSLSDLQWKQPPAAPAKRQVCDATQAFDAVEAIVAPFQVGGWTNGMLTAELRVSCVKCGRPIPINAEICPFFNCRVRQPKLILPGEKDSDFDRMPDEWEKKYGLNVAMDDAAQDYDADGFTNYEEYFAHTDPKDPNSFPPPVAKLRVVKTGSIPFPLVFCGKTETSKGNMSFQVKSVKTGRDSFPRIGEKVEGYLVSGYEPKTRKVRRSNIEIVEDVSVLKLSKDGKNYQLIMGDKNSAGEQAAKLVYLIDNTQFTVKKGDVLSLKNFKYKIVDIEGKSAIVQDMQSGAQTTLEPSDGLLQKVGTEE